MGEMNYHGRIMNIPVAKLKVEESTADSIDRVLIYRYGHRDARHAAAEIAAEADARIAALEAQLERAREAGTWHPVPIPPNTIVMIWNGTAIFGPVSLSEDEAAPTAASYGFTHWLALPPAPGHPAAIAGEASGEEGAV